MSATSGSRGRQLTRGEVAALTGINIETVRYYERIGFLPDLIRNVSGYRIYGHNHVMRLHFIRRGRDLGFTLRELRELLQLVDGGDYSCAEVKTITLDHADAIKGKIADLRKMHKVLREMASRCECDTVPECPIIDALFHD